MMLRRGHGGGSGGCAFSKHYPPENCVIGALSDSLQLEDDGRVSKQSCSSACCLESNFNADLQDQGGDRIWKQTSASLPLHWGCANTLIVCLAACRPSAAAPKADRAFFVRRANSGNNKRFPKGILPSEAPRAIIPWHRRLVPPHPF